MLFLILCLCVPALAQNVLQVNTTEGVIEGSLLTDGSHYAFYGVPYAGSTSGENRFKGPTPPARYPGVFHAMDANVICAQPSSRGLIGVENCLTLNIFTRNTTTRNPVIVWLNAEEYTTTNTGLYSYKPFIEQGLLFVNMNFRLSVFGFLCLGVPEAPGNAGLKDIIQGLTWIKANIANFGGDPDNVILMGHGSAAALVDIITLSPRGRNLFHKAITLSGSALAPWAVAYDPIGYANILARRLSYTKKNGQELAKLLQNTDITLLISALDDFKFTNNTPLFAPCIENPIVSPNDTVLTEAPINILRAGNYSQVPYIAAYTTREGTMRAGEAITGQWLEKMQANFSDFLPVDLNVAVNRTGVALNVSNFYFSGSPINMATIEDYLDYHGDTLVLVSVIKGAWERALTSSTEVRLLEFAYRGTYNSDWPYNQIPLTGVRHGGILNYLFDFDLRDGDRAVMASLITRFARFSLTGHPTQVGASNIVEWLPITRNSFNYLVCTGRDGPIPNVTWIYEEEPRTNPHVTRMTFWNENYEKYYHAPTRVSSSEGLMALFSIVILSQFFVYLF